MEENRIVIIDGNSLINRAYYAIQRPMITKEGLYTHAVYGFLNMLAKIKTDYEPGRLVVAFDRKAPTFRHKEYTEYKAGRKKMPLELVMQLEPLKEVLEAMKIPMLEIDGFEADDIIGTVAKRGEEAGLAPFIITGDRDELQLATDITKVLITKKGISEFELYDRQAMIDKYGFTPEQFIDYKGLMGDASDNIPGLPGVGEKTAQKLILQFGTVANLLARTEEIDNAKLRQKVEEHADLAAMSRRLAAICTDVPIDIDFEACRVQAPDYQKLVALYRKLEFNSFLKKLSASGELSAADAASAAEPKRERRRVSYRSSVAAGSAELRRAAEQISACSEAVLKVWSDGNHTSLPEITALSVLADETCYYLVIACDADLAAIREVWSVKMPRWIGHYLQKDYYALTARGGFDPAMFDTAFDTALAQYLLDPVRTRYELPTMALDHLGESLQDEKEFTAANSQIDFLSGSAEKFAEYGGRYCALIAELAAVLAQMLEEKELEEVFYQVELPLVRVLASMEVRGFAVDREELTAQGKELAGRIAEVENRIYELAGEQFNINSPKQLGVILFEKLGLPGAKKTKTGYATGAEILEHLRDTHEIAEQILEYRMLTKLSSTYVEGLLPLIHTDGKIHAHFQQTVTATGRISCTEPNLQNIPVRQELGRRLRKAFVPESDDYILVGADYSQIELRVLAHLSQDTALIEAFNQKQDIHRSTAARVFGVPEDQVTSLMRSNAKAVNFGVIYGMSGFGLASELNITRKEAEAYIDGYFRKYARVKEYMDAQVAACRKQGYVTTLMNRRREIPDIAASNYMTRQAGERLAMNTPIQGSAADIIKLAMIKVADALHSQCRKSHLVLQVHDELIIQAHKSELAAVKQLLTENMEQAVELRVLLTVDLNTGENWYDLK